jgi:two-component system response regulator CpxR
MEGQMESRVKPGESEDSTATSVLIIEDDVDLCELLREFFAEYNINVDYEHDGRRGLSRALRGGYDMLLLDVMIPGLDGFELLRQVRRNCTIPVIMLTARTGKVDRLAGLDAGADDYVPKPFDPDELLARSRAVLRRSGRTIKSDELLDADGIRLIPAAREVWCEGVAVPVTTIEYDILEFLARAAGRVISRDQLTVAIYRRQASPFDRAIDVHISRLRKKLGHHGDRIRTVRGAGYLYRAGPAGEDVR